MTSTPIDVPVLIVGGGPVGLTLAMDLAWRGIKSIILETRDDLPANPRCNTTNARSMEIFRRLGCADAVRWAGLPEDNNTDVVYMTTMNGHDLVRYARATPRQVRDGTAKGIGADWPTPEPQHFISQLYLEPVLRRHAVSHFGVDLRLGTELLSFAQDDDGVTAEAQDAATGETLTFRARYMVGADGSNSLVRRNIGARLEGIPVIGNTCSLFVHSARMTEIYNEHPGWMYRMIGGVVIVAIDGKDEWLIHVNLPPGVDLETYDPEPRMFAAVGERFEYEVINLARWTARAMVANKFREKHVFLAGDAAHIWIPMGGFGMNAGIGDSVSIGWMLAGALQGWLDPKILDAYETERTPMGSKVASQAARWGRDLVPVFQTDPATLVSEEARRALGRHIYYINISEFESCGMQLGYSYENSPIIAHDGTAPPVFSLETYEETSWPGARAPHLWLAPGKALFDAFGKGFTLLRIGPNPPSGEALIALANARDIPLEIVDLPMAEAVAKYQSYGLVLVRPDQYIVWRSKTDIFDPAAILDRITGIFSPERQVIDLTMEKLAGGFIFGEGPRWRDGKLFFSDIPSRVVLCFDPVTRAIATIAEVPHQPNGLGFLPDGRLIVASMLDGRLYAITDGQLSEYADLSPLVTGRLNDMIVDAKGRFYVGDMGARGATQELGRVILVESDGACRIVLEDVLFPNGIVITPDGGTLLLAESTASRVSQCRIEPNGDLSEARPFIDLAGRGCDGLAIDTKGGVWVCLPRFGIERYDAAGRLTHRVQTDGWPIAAALADDATLYVVGVDSLPEGADLFVAVRDKQTRGWVGRVDVSGNGLDPFA